MVMHCACHVSEVTCSEFQTHIGKPLAEDVEPIALPDLLLNHAFVIAVVLERCLLRLARVQRSSRPRRRRQPPARKRPLEPVLPVVIHGRRQDNHERELEEQHAVKHKRRRTVAPRFEALRNVI
jgi:hypothetical protein